VQGALSRAAAILFAGAVVLPLLIVALVAARPMRVAPLLDVEMRAEGGTAARLYVSAEGERFGEPNKIEVPFSAPAAIFQHVLFRLPERRIDHVAFVPTDAVADVFIRSMRVIDRQGRTLRVVDPATMLNYGEALLTMAPDGTTRIASPTDPAVMLFDAAWLTPPPSWFSLRLVTGASLAWIACAAAGLLLAGLTVIGRTVTAGRFGLREGLWLGALLLVVASAKLCLLRAYPAPLPYWDAWDAEAATVYVPYESQALSWRQMFAPHNEHRIFFTRLLALALLRLNGQWDPRLQACINVMLHSLTAVLVAVMLWMAAGRRWIPLVVLLSALAFGPPFDWENTLSGFQSCFYFFALFSMMALWLLGFHRAGDTRWWLGFLFALALPFTLAGAMITLLTIGALVVVRAIFVESERRTSLVTLAAVGASLALSWATLGPPSVGMRAASLSDFAGTLVHALSFPWRLRLACLVAWAPVVVLAVCVARRPRRVSGLQRLVLALSLWVLANAAVLAYARGAAGEPPGSRYLDTLSFTVIVNGLALWTLCRPPGQARWIGGALMLAYLGWTGAGLLDLSRAHLQGGALDRAIHMRAFRRDIRRFLRSGDAEPLMRAARPQDRPHPVVSALLNWLREPAIRRMLPPDLRDAVPVEASDAANAGWRMVADDQGRMWTSRSTLGRAEQGRLESKPFPCGATGHLRFALSTDVDDAALSLVLKGARNGSEIRVTTSTNDSRHEWSDAVVACPDDEVRVIAIDATPNGWLAFREPVEIGRLAAVAELAIAHADLVAGAAVLLALAAGGCDLSRRGRRRNRPSRRHPPGSTLASAR
jgi:hypothetical protein